MELLLLRLPKATILKETFDLSLALPQRQLSLFAFPLKDKETPGLKRRLPQQQQQLFLHHVPPVLVKRPGQVRSSSGVGSGFMLFSIDKTKCLNHICLRMMTSKPALTMLFSLALNY